MKVSATVATALICLAAGAGVGVLAMTYLGPSSLPEETAVTDPGGMMGGAPGGPPGGMMGGAPGGAPGGMMGGAPGGAPGGMGGGGRGPSAKNQLAALVTKLDLVTRGALTVELAPAERQAVAEQIRGLEALEELTDDDAQQRIDLLLESLAGHKSMLISAGYRWPDSGGSRPSSDKPNPFADEAQASSLKSLQEYVAAGAN